MQLRFMSVTKPRSIVPVIAQITMRVHVKHEHEYHSNAYAIRVIGDVTELLISDDNNILKWLTIEQLETVNEYSDKGQ